MAFGIVAIIRLCGIAGILGALVMGTGDLLYNHVPGSRQTLYEKMSTFSLKRLVSAGALGLIGSWLYLLGAFHLYFAFRSVGEDISSHCYHVCLGGNCLWSSTRILFRDRKQCKTCAR